MSALQGSSIALRGSSIAPRALAAGAIATAVAVAVQSALLARLYPSASFDADLLSYLVYFRELVHGEPASFGYTVPKVLPVVLLGPLGEPGMAQAVSIGVASAGGALLFVAAARAFGLAVAALASLLYVLDPLRAVLTLRSGVDLYIGVALLAAALAIGGGRALLGGALVLVAALGKPVAALCGLAVLMAPGASRMRRAIGAALPALALPASALLAGALAGRGLGGVLALPDEHERFVHVAQGDAVGAGGALHLLLVDWFGGTLFHRSWVLVAVGTASCALALVRRRGAGAAARTALVAVPMLLLAGYLAVAAREPLVVFTRFFWPVALLATVLAAVAACGAAARVPGPRWLGGGLGLALALLLIADRWDDHRWREAIMLVPFETHAGLASEAVERIARDEGCAGPALVPLAYLPLAAWRAPAKLARGELCALEDWADGRGCARPNCVLVMPAAPTTARAREAMARLVGSGFVVEVEDAHGALVRSNHG